MIRMDNSKEIDLFQIETFKTRATIRSFILGTWSKELVYTKYRYFVEKLSNKKRIYLERPGRLNKGCDFVIYIENDFLWKNGNDKPPAHNYLFDDLNFKRQSLNDKEWKNFMNAVEIIYNCKAYSNTLKYINNLPAVGKDYELILKLIRWFFVEQDLTYWSGEGREMLYNGILNV